MVTTDSAVHAVGGRRAEVPCAQPVGTVAAWCRQLSSGRSWVPQQIRARARVLERRVGPPVEGHRCMFDFQARAECLTPSAAIIHDELPALPSPVEVEETLPLTGVEDFQWLEEAELDDAPVRGAPLPKHGAAELQALHHTGCSTDPARTLQPSSWSEAIQTQPGEMGRRIEENIQRIRAILRL